MAPTSLARQVAGVGKAKYGSPKGKTTGIDAKCSRDAQCKIGTHDQESLCMKCFLKVSLECGFRFAGSRAYRFVLVASRRRAVGGNSTKFLRLRFFV